MSWDDAQESLDLATFDSTVRRVAALWTSLDGRERGNLTRKDRALTNALYALVEHLAGQKFERSMPDPVNRAPSVTGFYQPGPDDYPAERRRVRENALHHARKLYEINPYSDPHQRAAGVTLIAQAFERYLTDGTVHQEPTNTEVSDDNA